jgi:hypothetical protein
MHIPRNKRQKPAKRPRGRFRLSAFGLWEPISRTSFGIGIDTRHKTLVTGHWHYLQAATADKSATRARTQDEGLATAVLNQLPNMT